MPRLLRRKEDGLLTMDLERKLWLLSQPITLDNVPAMIIQTSVTHVEIYVVGTGTRISIDWFSVDTIISSRQGRFFSGGSNTVNLDAPGTKKNTKKMFAKRFALFIEFVQSMDNIRKQISKLDVEGPDVQSDCEALTDAINYVNLAVVCLKDVGTPKDV